MALGRIFLFAAVSAVEFYLALCLRSPVVLKLFQNPLDSTSQPFQRMVVERRYTGRVYIGGVNRLFQLSSDLELQNRFETGPVEDSVECSAAGVCDGVKKQPTDNFNKALTIYEKTNKLIACGSVRQGICRMHNVYNISSVDPPTPEAVVANDKDSSSVVFVAPGPPDPSVTDALYAASTFTDAGNYRDEVPAVATLSLQPENLFKVAHRNINSETQILVERSKRKSYKIDYVYGFASGDYSYFLTRQQTSSTVTSPIHSKVVRLCQKDKFYYSYSEVPLECRAADGTDYNLLQAAYIGKAGYDLATNMSISTEDDVLFGVFSKGEGDQRQFPSKSSALCVYSLKYVDAKFAENIRICAKGNVMRGLDFFKKDTSCLKTSLDSLCGSEVNYPLGGSVPISQKPVFVSATTRLASVAATTTHMYTVVFLGTEDGQLKKLVVETSGESNEYESVDLDNGGAPIVDLQLDISGEFLYALTNAAVSKAKLYDCEHFDRCTVCLAAQDPYCGWCNSNSKCVAKQPCEANSWLSYKDAQCTEITKVTPSVISISQAEYLNVEIQNLPSFSGQLSCVFGFGRIKLTTGAQKTSSGAITCTTPQTNLLPPVPPRSDFLPATLSVQIDNGADFAATNFTFFDCSSYVSCDQCSNARFPCDWCVETGLCAHNAQERCRGQRLVNSVARQGSSTSKGPAFCPGVVEIDQVEMFASSGTVKEISVRGVNLMDFQRQFVCRLEFTSRTIEVKAKLDNNLITCSAINLTYDESFPNVTAKINILWTNEKMANFLDNTRKLRVIIYKCERLATNCGLCLSLNAKFECGWCDDRKTCSTPQRCDSPSHWLEKSTLCPNPEIFKLQPTSGPVEGGTRVTIEGANLGRSFADIQNNVRLVYVPCAPIEELYRVSRKIVCVTGPSHSLKPSNGSAVVQIRDEQKYLAVSPDIFYYVDPIITGFSPTSGPQSGGTVVTIEGDNLNAGSNITASIGGVPCYVIETSRYRAKCRTGLSTSANKLGAISMEFDNKPRLFNRYQFTYEQDPRVFRISRERSILSGGLSLEATGTRFALAQEAVLYFARNGRRYESPCVVESNDKMRCSTPGVISTEDLNYQSDESKFPIKVDYGFVFDGVEAPKNLTRFIDVYPNPQLFQFSPQNSEKNGEDYADEKSGWNADKSRRIKYYSDFLIVQGKNLDKVVTIDDVRVFVGAESCNVSTWQNQAMTCKLPPKAPKLAPGQTGSLPEVVVVIGDNQLNYSLGYLSYDDRLPPGAPPSTETVVAALAALALFLVAIVALVIAYRRKASRQRGQMRRLKDQIDAIELKVASECKEAFAELQTDMTELAADLAAGIPFLAYRDYAMQVLFPGQASHPVVRDLDVDARARPQIEKGLQQFNQLLNNKQFLLLLIRTLESNRYFVSQSRVAVGSLLMVILQEKMEYCTDVLKSLLSELIDRTMERRYQPKILFRRSESVAERMLGVWYTFLLYRYVVDCAGQPLFTLYWAIKQQVDKGPQDSVTYEARYSLSEEKLVRQTVDFHALTVYVSNFDNGTETPVRVFDCDTITQVKEKCLDAVFKTTPYSRRPSPNEVDLEWRTGVSGRLILQDFNSTTKIEAGNWRRINTLGHYKVPNNASLALVPKQASVYNLSLLSERSDKSSTFSLKRVSSNSPVLTRPFAGSVAAAPQNSNGSGYFGTKDSRDPGYNRVFHLIKPADQQDPQSERNSGGGGKMMSEIYLTRLLTTKGTLLKFVEDLFEAIFSTAYRGTSLPMCVKYMFDFMDEQALKHGIQEPEVVHTWKSNSLPLRFWVNLIKNPHFVFDIARPIKIEGCLSVVAQTLMDSCSTQDPQLTKDSPSSKLLFAREIHTYREWVERYYDDVRATTVISDQDMSAYLNEESRLHLGEFNVGSALYELFKYVKQYAYDQLGAALEADESLRRSRIPAKFEQMVRNVEGSAAVDPVPAAGGPGVVAGPPAARLVHAPPDCYTYGDVSLPR